MKTKMQMIQARPRAKTGTTLRIPVQIYTVVKGVKRYHELKDSAVRIDVGRIEDVTPTVNKSKAALAGLR